MQKQIRKFTKILCIWLCGLMVAGVVPVSTHAEEIQNSQSQIGSYYEADDTNGILPSSPELSSENTEQSYADGKVKVNKTISATGEENVFDITLSVSTQEKIEEGSFSPDAAAVLVIDCSGSMADGRTTKRLSSAKKAAQTFINSFAAEGVKRKIAIVSYSNGATTVQGWTNASALSTSDNTNYCSAISGLSAGGGTNTEAGMILGRNLLNENLSANSAIQGIENKNIILLTDGKPTYGIKDESEENYASETNQIDIESDENGFATGNDYVGNGMSTTCETHEDVETITANLKTSGYGTYAIYVGNQNVDCENQGCSLNKSGAKWLAEDCGFTTYAASDSDLDKLVDIFKEIVELIEMKARAWILTDPMGTNINFAEFVTESVLVNEFTEKEGTITWDLKNSPRGIKQEENGITTTTYDLTYRVRLNTLMSGYQAGTFYATNGVTGLTYLITETRDGITTGTPGTAYFNVPSVKGFDGDFTFKKVDESGSPLTGATFTLSKDGWSMTATSGSDGTVTFQNIPSGHTFILTETEPPVGYQKSSETYHVTISYGVVKVTDSTGKDVSKDFAFINESNKITIPVTKIWKDGDNIDKIRPKEIVVQLCGDGKPVEGKTLSLKEADGWTGVFADIPEYKAGKKIVYTIEEKQVPEGYTAEITGNVTDGFTITNTHVPDKTLTIQKMVGGNMGEKSRAFEFTLKLTKGGQPFTGEIRKITGSSETKVSANEKGVYTFELKHEEKVQFKIPHGCVFEVTEKGVFGYKTEVQMDDAPAEETETAKGVLNKDSTILFTNTREMLIPTGVVANNVIPAAWMMFVALLGVGIFFVKCRKRS